MKVKHIKKNCLVLYIGIPDHVKLKPFDSPCAFVLYRMKNWFENNINGVLENPEKCPITWPLGSSFTW